MDHGKRGFISKLDKVCIQFRIMDHLRFFEPVRPPNHTARCVLPVAGRDHACHLPRRGEHHVFLTSAFRSEQGHKRTVHGTLERVHSELCRDRWIEFRFQLLA